MNTETNPLQDYMKTQKEKFLLMLALMRESERLLSSDDSETDRTEEIKDAIKKLNAGAAQTPNFLAQAGLTETETDLYLLRIVLSEFPDFERRCEIALGNSYGEKAELRFLSDLLRWYHGDEVYECFRPESNLFKKGLIAMDPETEPNLEGQTRILLNPFFVDMLQGRKTARAYLKFYDHGSDFPEPYQEKDFVEGIITALELNKKANSRVTHVIHGPAGSGKRRLARKVCSRAQLPFIEISLPFLARYPFVVMEARNLIRAAAFHGHALLLTQAEILLDEKQSEFRDLLNEELVSTKIVAFITSEKRLNLTNTIEQLTTIQLHTPSRAIRERIWRDMLVNCRVDEDVSASELARLFHINGEPIRAALREAEGVAGGDGSITRKNLLSICRSKSTSRLSELAFLVEPKFGWDDLILAPHMMHLIREIESDISADEHVFEQWRMDRVATAAKGHNILFSGIPGTGKTMAASIIAAELGLELYKIDLSRVSSKYVGEVEKNLASLFDEAEKANAALFFDEADSLLGKRGKNETAQGHYINQQVGYLLQRLEEYNGIAFMATNFHENIDAAFERRFNYVVRFNYPGEEERIRLWEHSFSPETPLANDIDFKLLGQEFECTGAHIKSIALRAARRAAADDARNPKVVTNFDIIYGTVREFDKIKPGWDVGYKDAYKEEVARVRAMISSSSENSGPGAATQSQVKQIRPEDLDWGPDFN